MNVPRPVLVLGDLLVDVVMPIPAYPPVGGDALSNDTIVRAGGSAVNTACVLAKLGLSTRLVGRTGRDIWGEFELAELRRAGVDVSGVVQDSEAGTGLTFVPVTPDGERTLFSYRGANNRTSPEDLQPELFEGADFLHLSGYAFLNVPQRDAARRALALAREAGVPVSLDTGLAPVRDARDEIDRALRQVDLCVMGLEEAHQLTGADRPDGAADVLLGCGLRTVALKLGPQGCLLANPTQRLFVPGIAVDVIDTTGAGDSFGAGLIFAHRTGFDLPAAGLLAVTLGGLAATVWGGGPALPGKTEVIRYLERLVASGTRPDWHAAARAVIQGLAAAEIS